MSTIEKLRPFVSLCQACGMMPYTMEYDSKTKQFKNFAFSWKSRATLWFLPVFTFQAIFPLATSNLTKDIFTDEIINAQIPTTLSILTSSTIALHVVQLVLSKYVFLRSYRRLQRIALSSLKVEHLLKKTSRPYQSNLTKKFYVGFFSIATTVSYFSIVLPVTYLYQLKLILLQNRV